MIVSENTLKWVMRFYPPLFFQRVWVKKFEKDYMGVEVKIFKSVLNSNYNRSIFGGTIFSASDPFYALLLGQILQRRGFKITVWLKSAQIKYLKPGKSDLIFRINLSENDINEAENVLKNGNKFIKAFPLEIYNLRGELCASVINEVYIRNLHSGENSTIAY
ncbi:MAG: DUF4442 domain-containing protein [Daejeonella sp.]